MRVLIKTEVAINHYGDVAKLADEIELTVQAIYQWGEYVPDTSVGKIMATAASIPFVIDRTRPVHK